MRKDVKGTEYYNFLHVDTQTSKVYNYYIQWTYVTCPLIYSKKYDGNSMVNCPVTTSFVTYTTV